MTGTADLLDYYDSGIIFCTADNDRKCAEYYGNCGRTVIHYDKVEKFSARNQRNQPASQHSKKQYAH